MKILHVVQAYHPVKGGAEWLAQNLSEQMVQRHGDEVTVFTAAVTKPAYFWRNEGGPLPVGTETINGVTVRRFPVYRGLRWLRMLWAHGAHRFKLPYHDWARAIQLGPIIWGFAWEIAHQPADVIMASTFPFLHMQYAVAGAKRSGKPMVLLGAIHTGDVWGYDRKMIIDAVKQADAYLALTTFEKEYLVGKGVVPDKIHVIGGGVDVAPFVGGNGRAMRDRYQLADNPVIIVLCRHSELKRLDTVIAAMPHIWAQQPDAHLLLAGARTNYSAKLDQLIAALPPVQQAKIHIINDFPESEKPDLLAAADLLVHSSGNESFGIVFAEAWAAGKPVIGADVGALASLIDAGKDGLLFRYGDAASMADKVVTLLTQPAQRAAMGAAGREKVLANFTWEKVADKVRQVYLETISRHQR
ncbi:MAG: glycosyltransferase family 4 protein [Anaerolineaceae bacterium]|nr:glycosyltransferase family 4 protein [Anaerolineaceae bacterium]